MKNKKNLILFVIIAIIFCNSVYSQTNYATQTFENLQKLKHWKP